MASAPSSSIDRSTRSGPPSFATKTRPTYQPRVEKVWILDKQPNHLKVPHAVDASVTRRCATRRTLDLDHENHSVHWRLDKTATDNTIADCDGGRR